MDKFVNFFSSVPKKFSDSAKELGKIHTITIVAMLLALRIVLGMFANLQLSFFPYAKLSFTFIPLVLVAYYFGPVSSIILAVLGDVLSYILVPTATAFTPGITAGYIIEATVLGLIYYHENISISRSTIAQILSTVLGGLAINTYFIYTFYGLSYIHLLLLRSALLIPWSLVQVAITVLMINALNRVPIIKKNLSN